MSNTPRTDSQINGKGTLKLGGDPLKYAMVESEFARQLERELSAANRKIQRMENAAEIILESCPTTWQEDVWNRAKKEKVS